LRIRDLVNVFDYLFKRVSHQRVRIAVEKVRAVAGKPKEAAGDQDTWKYEPMDYFAKEFYDTKEDLVVGEMQILKRYLTRLLFFLYGTRLAEIFILDSASISLSSIPMARWSITFKS
jgi:hypothetical protein